MCTHHSLCAVRVRSWPPCPSLSSYARVWPSPPLASVQIVYRDLKPENLVLTEKGVLKVSPGCHRVIVPCESVQVCCRHSL